MRLDEKRKLVAQARRCNWRRQRAEAGITQEAEAGREWIRKNPQRYRIKAALRRADTRRATPIWVDHALIAEKYAEAHRLTQETGIPHEVDHIIPLKALDENGVHIACGLHVASNLRVTTRRWNRQRRNILNFQLTLQQAA